jgi:hypothetical protein
MKFNTVRIDPTLKKTWRISFQTDDKERVNKKSVPHAMGFFHYPQTMSKEEAFKALKDCMIQSHLDEIEKLKESVAKLKVLNCT